MSESVAIPEKRRRYAVKNAVSSSLLEGIKPSVKTIENLNRYADGQVSIQDLIADAKRRYARV